MEVYSADRSLRATILEGGEVRNEHGVCVGYVNEDGTAGDMYDFLFSYSYLAINILHFITIYSTPFKND